MIFLPAIALFMAFFFFYPLAYVFKESIADAPEQPLYFYSLLFQNDLTREALTNSLFLAVAVTGLTTLLGIPLAWSMTRYEFRFKGLLSALIMMPLILPPFVAAIGMSRILARFGTINLFLLEAGIIDQPIDWFGRGGFWGVVILSTLHLYPIMYLNVSSALANVDPSTREAAQSLGASGWRLFRTVTFPLALPGYFAGAIIVFVWAFTDLGTPLMFQYRRVVPVQIFDQVTDINANPAGYALVVFVLLVTLVLFVVTRRLIGTRKYEAMAKGTVGSVATPAPGKVKAVVYPLLIGISLVALLPHVSILLTSVSEKWFMTPVPEEYTTGFYQKIFEHGLTIQSIRNSLFLSLMSTGLDVLIGVTLAFILARRRIPFAGVLDAMAMLPLAVPGLVLAFGYVGCYANTWLDPMRDPTILLVVSYAIRRLPYVVRAALAGFQQIPRVLEEASENLGAGPLRTVIRITLPLMSANIAAGVILAFSFAMLEVSDSLILAFNERDYPITKAIYHLMSRITDGAEMASALGVLGMILLGGSLLVAGLILGRRLGELFKIG